MSKKGQNSLNLDWEENFVNLDTGIVMAYTVCGPTNGVPIVLIHGATDSRYSWSQLAPILAKSGYRCYVPELRGHGKSTKTNEGGKDYNVEVFAKDMANFIEKLPLNKFILVGNSLGSFVIQELLISIPDKIEKSVLLASGLAMKDNIILDWLLKGGVLEVVNVHFEGLPAFAQKKSLPDDFLQIWAMTTNEDKAFASAILENARSLPYETWVGVFENASKFNNEGRLSGIKHDLLFIWGSEDAFFTKAEREHFLNQFVSANIQSFEIEGGSHNVHWDNVDSCNRIANSICDFINQ